MCKRQNLKSCSQYPLAGFAKSKFSLSFDAFSSHPPEKSFWIARRSAALARKTQTMGHATPPAKTASLFSGPIIPKKSRQGFVPRRLFCCFPFVFHRIGKHRSLCALCFTHTKFLRCKYLKVFFLQKLSVRYLCSVALRRYTTAPLFSKLDVRQMRVGKAELRPQTQSG